MKRKSVGTVVVLSSALGFWAGRKTADIVGAALYFVREGDGSEEEDTNLAVQMFDAVHDMLSSDLELRLTEEGLRP